MPPMSPLPLPARMDLTDRVAVVTGAGSPAGIGYAVTASMTMTAGADSHQPSRRSCRARSVIPSGTAAAGAPVAFRSSTWTMAGMF